MKAFWEKTKEQAKLGVNSIQRATGTAKTEETEIFTNTFTTIKSHKERLDAIQKDLDEYKKNIVRYGESSRNISIKVAALFPMGEENQPSAAINLQSNTSLYTESNNMSYYLTSHVGEQVHHLIVDLGLIFQTEESRNKYHVLLLDAEKEIKTRSEKGKPVAEYEAKAEEYRKQFNQYDQEFMEKANAYIAKAPSAYASIFEAFQYYNAVYAAAHQRLLITGQSYDPSRLAAKYPDTSVAAPAETPAK